MEDTMRNDMSEVLASLGVPGQCVRAERHRHLAFFDIKLERKASALSKLEKCGREIALHMQTKTTPIMKLIPEEGVVRLQVALSNAAPIQLRKLVSGQEIPKGMVFPLLLGEDDSGKRLWMDMNHNPHLLVAGTTGSGKSTLLHTLLSSAMFLSAVRHRNIWVFLGDPKRVEFHEYNPKVNSAFENCVVSIESTLDGIISQLEYLYETMESRYEMMQHLKMRSIEEDPQKFPLILSVIDEVSDLMMQDKKGGKMQDLLIKIAQKGRAAGIFLVLATQRPSVDVITGLIKANFPGRIACKTASRKDSEVILDRPGAENLLGRGDAVLQNMRYDSVRFQVAYTTPEQAGKDMQWLQSMMEREAVA